MTETNIHPREGFELESDEPVRAYALIRIQLVLVGLVASIPLEFRDDDRLTWLLGAVFLPASIVIFLLARRRPGAALSRGVAIGDLISLTLLLAFVPTIWAAIHFCALILVMAFPLVRGDREGLAFAILVTACIVPTTLLVDVPPPQDRLLFYEVVFGIAAIAGAAFMGRVAASEQTARVRARELTRRIIEASAAARHEVAVSLHDGPVQELVGVSLQIESAMAALARGDENRVRALLLNARLSVERNVESLRNEMISLGPVAFDELTFEAAIEQCAPAWSTRYGIDIRLEIDRVDLSNEACGALFGIAQEAIANAGRHAEADHVNVNLANADGEVLLRVRDDGKGFGDVSPLGPRQPGHLGLASMRERATVVGGELAIESSGDGTEVRVRLPGNGDPL
jgi:signal transduction histidine kinase